MAKGKAQVEIELPPKCDIKGGFIRFRKMTPKGLRDSFARYPRLKAVAPSCNKDGMVERSLGCAPADPRRFRLAEEMEASLDGEWRRVQELLDALEKPFGLDHIDPERAERLIGILWGAWTSLGLSAQEAPDRFPAWALQALPHLPEDAEAYSRREWAAWYGALASQPIRIIVSTDAIRNIERAIPQALAVAHSPRRKLDPDKIKVFSRPVPEAKTLAELIRAYENSEKRKLTSKYVAQANANNDAPFRVLQDVLGADRVVSTIGPDDLDYVGDIILALPPGAHGIHKRDAIGFIEIAAAAVAKRDADPAYPRGVTGLTLRKYFGAINAVFQLALSKRWIPAILTLDHGFTGKAKGAAKAKSKRSALSLDQLQRLFHRDYFDDLDGKVPVVNRWILVVGIYQGARPGEIAQLDPHDVYLDNASGHWVINFTEEGCGKTLKTDASMRKIPVHPRLIELGFIKFVQRRQDEGHPKLFRVRPVPVRGKLLCYDSVRDGLTAQLKETGIYKTNVFTPNSTRHTWRACALSRKVLNEHRNALGGWTLEFGGDSRDDYSGNAQGAYGQFVAEERFAFPVEDLLESLKRVDYAGLFEADPPEGWRPAVYERCSSKDEPKRRQTAEEKAAAYEKKKLRERLRSRRKREAAKAAELAQAAVGSLEAEAMAANGKAVVNGSAV